MLQKATFWWANEARVSAIVPAGVAHFDDARIFDELAQQPVEIFAVQRSVFERQGKLNEERAEASVIGESVETFAGASFVFVSGTDGRGGGRTPSPQWASG